MQQKTFNLVCEELEPILNPGLVSWIKNHPLQTLGIWAGGSTIIITGAIIT